MPIPPLNQGGLLPVGIHETELDEIRRRFGSFQGSDRRIQLFARPVLRRRFGFDVLLATDGGADYERFVEFFSRVREDASVRKGMLRIAL